MPQCSATCKDGGPCHHSAKPGHTVCGKHTNQGKTLPVKTVYVILCGKVMTNGTKCKCPREKGKKMCKKHLKLEEKRERKQRFRDMWEDALDLLWEGQGPVGFTGFVTQKLEEFTATADERLEFRNKVNMELEFYFTIHPAVGQGQNPPRTELEGLARDNQNVHTGPVNKQTQDGVTALLETPVAVGQDTLAELERAWRTQRPASRKSVLKDVSRWYQASECRQPGDHLYQRLLDGLWTRIKLSKHKDDLIQRLWEECDESRKMCCEGHISRLCNVLVGYDESFKAPISTGETLQNRMSAIAAEDMAVPDKVVKAWEVFEELQVPQEQRRAWIEAF